MATQTRYKRRSSGCRLLASGCLRTLGAFLPIATAIVETGSWISLAIREASSRPDWGLKRAWSALAKAELADTVPDDATVSGQTLQGLGVNAKDSGGLIAIQERLR